MRHALHWSRVLCSGLLAVALPVAQIPADVMEIALAVDARCRLQRARMVLAEFRGTTRPLSEVKLAMFACSWTLTTCK